MLEDPLNEVVEFEWDIRVHNDEIVEIGSFAVDINDEQAINTYESVFKRISASNNSPVPNWWWNLRAFGIALETSQGHAPFFSDDDRSASWIKNGVGIRLALVAEKDANILSLHYFPLNRVRFRNINAEDI